MVPQEISAKYEVRGTLGSGAMGTVYDAFDRLIERRVAIKVVRLAAAAGAGDTEATEARVRFRREAQAAGRLSHPNIVAVHDYGESGDCAWIVMELVEGGSLKALLDRGERLALPAIARVMDQVLAALAYSHARGVVHRDIKPANIMLTPDGPGGPHMGGPQVKIADFGIARLENSSMTQVGTVMGTPSYMAPEQLRGEPVDARADLWAAGVVLYQLLTGEKPFEGGFSAVMHKALNDAPTPPSRLSVTAPRAFDAVVAQALAKRPEDRFQGAAAFAEAIRAAAAAGPETAAAAVGLPFADADATMVAGSAAARPEPPPAGTDAAAAVAAGGRGGRRPLGLIAGGVAGALAAAGAATWFLVIEPQGERNRQEQARIEAEAAADRARREQDRIAGEAAAREAAERERAAQEQAARGQAAREAAAREQAAAEAAARERAAQEQAMREREAAEAAAREAAARDQAARDGAAREQATRERTAAETAVREATAREAAAREAAAREAAAREAAAREAAAQERAAREAATREMATREATAREQAMREQAARESAARGQAAREQQVAQLQAPPKIDLRAAAQAAAAVPSCGLLAWSATDQALTLAGVLRRGEEAAVQRELAGRAVPDGAARLRIERFDGPYCGALDVLRPALAAPEAAPLVSILGHTPLAKGQLLRFEVALPDWPSQLYVAYLMQSGEVAHLVPAQPQPASARIRLGEPRQGFPGWEVDEPFGTDLMLVIAAERPLFGAARPVVEPLGDYVGALAAALRRARQEGWRVTVRPAVVETVAR